MNVKRSVLCGFVALGMLLVLVAPTRAEQIWVGGVDDWADGTKWSGGAVPSGETAKIENGGTAEVTSAVPDLDDLIVNGGSTVIVKTNGSLSNTDDFKIGDSGVGFMVQEDGTVSTGDDLYLADDAGSSGTYTLSGGKLTVGDDLKCGARGTGLFEMQGGELTVLGYVAMTNYPEANGTLEISGGILNHTGTGGNAKFAVGDEAAGFLTVIGDAADIDVGDYIQRSDSILELVFKDGGISTISAQSLALAGTLDVSLAAGFTPTVGTYDILTATGTRTGMFGPENLPSGDWSVIYGPSIVQLEYVPEPSSIVLAVTALLGLLAYGWRRRRTA